MQIPAERWFNAVRKRKTVRNFLPASLKEKDEKKFKEFLEELNDRYHGIRVGYVQEGFQEVAKGFIGSYGKIAGAESYLVCLAEKNTPYKNEKVGYIGEAAVLEAVSMGIATCWVTGTYKKENVAKQIEIKDNESIKSVIALGYAKDKEKISEKLIKTIVSSEDRKPLDELCKDGVDENWPEWVKTALETARLAPSAINRQPWRFRVEDDGIVVYLADEKGDKDSKKLDCGISMLHLEVGALYSKVKGEWKLSLDPEVAKFIKK